MLQFPGVLLPQLLITCTCHIRKHHCKVRSGRTHTYTHTHTHKHTRTRTRTHTYTHTHTQTHTNTNTHAHAHAHAHTHTHTHTHKHTQTHTHTHTHTHSIPPCPSTTREDPNPPTDLLRTTPLPSFCFIKSCGSREDFE